jgi:hypothetical protein
LKNNWAWKEPTSRTTAAGYNHQEKRLILQLTDKPQIKDSVSVVPELEKVCKYCGDTVYFDQRIKSKNGFLIPLNKDRTIHDHPYLIRIAKATECKEVAFESLICHFFDGKQTTSTSSSKSKMEVLKVG